MAFLVLTTGASWAHLFKAVPGLREIVHEVANGRTYAEVQGGRWGKRARAIRKRNERMAREYRRRELAYELRSERISFGDLAIQIGRLPEFNLRRSAAIDAIKRGLPPVTALALADEVIE